MRVRSAVTAVALLIALMGFGTPAAHALLVSNVYNEVGDAGTLANPQLITGGPYTGIAGTLGEADTVDVFGFSWAGGAFEVTASYPGTVFLALFDALKDPEGSAVITPTLFYPALEAGSYFLKIATTAGADPPFTIQLTGPSSDSSLLAFVPGPPTLALVLLGAGLVGLSALWTRQRN